MQKNRVILANRWWIILFVSLLVLASIIIALNIPYISEMNEKEVLKNMNENQSAKNGNVTQELPVRMTQQQVLDYWKTVLPDKVNKEMYRVRFTLSQKFDISKWEIDPVKKQVTFYVFHIRDQSEVDNLQEEKIENWTIKIIHDTEFESEYDKTFSELKLLKKKPELQILTFDLHSDPWIVPPEKGIILWVRNQTQENQKIDKTELSGWNISVYIDSGVRRITEKAL